MYLKEVIVCSGVRGMHAGKDGTYEVTLFPFMSSFIDRSIRFENVTRVSSVHHMYSDTIHQVMLRNYGRSWRGT